MTELLHRFFASEETVRDAADVVDRVGMLPL